MEKSNDGLNPESSPVARIEKELGWFAGIVRRDVIGIVLLCVLGAVILDVRVFEPAHRSFVPLGNDDHYTKYYPNLHYMAERMSQGELPLWNPWQMAGAPFLAAPQSAVFYPANLIYLVVPVDQGMQILTIGHLFLASFLTYWFCRRMGASVLGSAVGGLIYAWTGYVIGTHFWLPILYNLAWLPALFLCVREIFRGGGARWSAGLAVTVAIQLVCGHQDFANQGLLAVAVFALFCLGWTAWTDSPKRAFSPLLWVGVGVGVGFLLGAPQWVTTYELVRGLAARGTTGLLDEQIEPFGGIPLVHLFGPEGRGHIGVMAGFLLPLGLFCRRLRVVTLFFIGVAALAALLSMGSQTPVFELYKLLPWGRWSRDPSKFLATFCFASAVLAALGSDAVREVVHRSVWTGAGVLALVFASFFFIPENQFLHVWQKEEVARLHEFDAEYSRLRRDLGFNRIVFAPEPGSYLATFERNATYQSYFRFQDFEQFLPKRYADYVSYAVDGKIEERRFPFNGTFDVNWVENRKLLEVANVAFHGRVMHRDVSESATIGAGVGSGVVEAASREQEEEGRGEDPGSPGCILIEKWPGALPRAYVVHGLSRAGSDSEILKTLASPEFDPRRTVLLDGISEDEEHPPEAALPGEGATILSYEPECVELLVTLKRPGAVVLVDLNFPGWVAESAGERLPIFEANYLFRSVLLPEGEHRVVFQYEPKALSLGVILAAIGGASLLGLFGLSLFASSKVVPGRKPEQKEG